MVWSDALAETFAIAGVISASLGGGGILVLALSSWLGKVWASRILEREKIELTRSIERTKADLTRDVERDKAALAAFLDEHRNELQQLATERLDALNRRRDVYARLATKMRILLRANMSSQQRDSEKWAFLAAYDEGYIWASETVAQAIRDLIEVMEAKAIADENLKLVPANAPSFSSASAKAHELDAHARACYQRCLLEMRKDCGFPDSHVDYRVISFG